MLHAGTWAAAGEAPGRASCPAKSSSAGAVEDRPLFLPCAELGLAAFCCLLGTSSDVLARLRPGAELLGLQMGP